MAETPDRERLEIARTSACDEVEDELADAARVQREGGDLATQYPALARHLEECEWCRTALAELVNEPDVLSEADIEPESSDRVERYLVAALETPERIVQVRAARQLGTARRVGPAALAALAEAAAEDRDEEVRAAALEALEELDAAQLGKEGVKGTLSAEEGELRLTLEGLPPSFEESIPVVAVPRALRAAMPGIEWSGGEPGLVSVEDAVSQGRLDVRLGRMLDPSAAPELTTELERLFVVKPRAPRPR
jgi:hypothetical protein